jgi:poly(hydroxyalkanoate) depolymerase family esterase
MNHTASSFRRLATGLGLGLVAALGLTLPGHAVPGEMIAGSHLGLAYKLHVPPQAEASRRPLVVMLHGCTQDPDEFALSTRMNDLADREGFLVLYPAQSPLTNPRRCWNWFLPGHQGRGQGEPGAIAALVEAIALRHAVDRRRIYVAGLSAGGGMAAILAATYPDVFAAATIVAGIPYAQARDTASAYAVMASGASNPTALAGPVLAAMGARRRRVPVLIVQGSRDARVAPVNADHLARQWAEANGLPTQPSELAAEPALPGTRPVERATWRDAEGQVLVERWLVADLAHAWPGGDAGGTHVDPVGPSGAEAAWRFFAQARPLAAP